MKSGPWLFDKHLVVLEIPVKNQRISSFIFQEAMFWIRLINLPMGHESRLAAKKIGNSIGKFLEMDCEKKRFVGEIVSE